MHSRLVLTTFGITSFLASLNLQAATTDVTTPLNLTFGGVKGGAAGAYPESGNDFNLNGGTLNFTGMDFSGAAGGLTLQVCNQQVARNARTEFGTLSGMTGLLNTSVPENLTSGTNALAVLDQVNVDTTSPFASAGYTAQADNMMGFWRGRLKAGSYNLSGNSDDGLVVYVNGVKVFDRNNFGAFAATPAPGAGNPLTVAGDDDEVLIGYYEGTGGAGYRLFKDGAAGAVPMAMADFIAAQPQTDLSAAGASPGGQNATLTTSSTITAKNTYGVSLNNLKLGTPGQTLTTGVLAGDGLVRFKNTGATVAGTTTLNTVSDVAMGLFSDAGNATVLAKTGDGALIFDNNSADGTMANTIVDVQGGRVILQALATATNLANFQPAKGAAFRLSGANTVLQLQSAESAATGQVLFDHAVTVNENATLLSAAHTGTREIHVGSATNGITIAPGKTLQLVSTSGSNMTLKGAITGGTNSIIRVNTLNDAPNVQGVVLMAAANPAFTGTLNVEGGGQVRLDNAGALSAALAVNVLSGGRIEFLAAGSFTSALPLTTNAGSSIRLNGQTAISAGQTLSVYPGRVLDIQNNNGFTSGTVLRAPNTVILVNAGNEIANTHQFNNSTLPSTAVRPLDVVRVNANMNGAGNAGGSIGSFGQGAIVQILGGDRNITQNTSLVINGQILTNDNNSRTITDNAAAGIRIEVGPNGMHLVGGVGNYLQILEQINVTGTSGRITFGSHIPLDNLLRGSAVLLGSPTNTWAGVSAPVDLLGGVILESVQQNNTTPTSGTTADFAVNLHRGTLRAIPIVNGAPAAHAGVSLIGKVNVTGAGSFLATRRATTNTLIELRIGSALNRSDDPVTTDAIESRGTLNIRTENGLLQDTGGSASQIERIRFSNLPDAPARATTSGALMLNMVAPWMMSQQDNGRFTDYDPAQDPATGLGFTLATKTDVNTTAALESLGAIGQGKITGNITLGAPVTVGSLIVSSNLTGSSANTLTVESGGLIVTGGGGAGIARIITAPVISPAGRELIIYSTGGNIHQINSTLTGNSGLTKFGASTLQLGADNSATLVGDIAINESSLVINGDNRLGAPTNKVIFNGGNLRPNADMTIARDFIANPGGAALANDTNRLVSLTGAITGPGEFRISPVNGNNGVTILSGSAANTFRSGLRLDGGILAFSRNNQLGADPDISDYDRGHVTINDTATNATLRLLTGSGTVTTTGRQLTLFSGTASAARIEVAGANDRLVIDNDIRGTGVLQKNGPGVLELTNPDGNGYTGGTVINGGTLVVNNTTFTATGSGGVTVRTGATLGGSGIAEGAIVVESGGILAPGNSPGKLTIGGPATSYAPSSLALAGLLNLDLNGASPGLNYDQVAVYGVVNLSSTAVVNLTLGFTPAAGQEFYLILNDGSDPIVGTFAAVPDGGSYTDGSGNNWIVNYDGNGDGGPVGNDLKLTFVRKPGAALPTVPAGPALPTHRP